MIWDTDYYSECAFQLHMFALKFCFFMLSANNIYLIELL